MRADGANHGLEVWSIDFHGERSKDSNTTRVKIKWTNPRETCAQMIVGFMEWLHWLLAMATKKNLYFEDLANFA